MDYKVEETKTRVELEEALVHERRQVKHALDLFEYHNIVRYNKLFYQKHGRIRRNFEHDYELLLNLLLIDVLDNNYSIDEIVTLRDYFYGKNLKGNQKAFELVAEIDQFIVSKLNLR